MMRKAFKFRCYPNKQTQQRLWDVMQRGVTPVWNACVAERQAVRTEYAHLCDEAICDRVYDLKRDLSPKEEKAIRKKMANQVSWPSAYSQYKHIRKRDHPEYADFYAKMLECTVAEVDGAEKSYRALWILGDTKARPPSEQRVHRVITYRLSGFKLNGSYLWLSRIGTMKIRLHRPVEGIIKTVTIREKNWKWYVSFSSEAEHFSGPCRSVSEDNPVIGRYLRQKHPITGGATREKTGAYNVLPRSQPSGGATREKTGAYNYNDHSLELSFRPHCFVEDSAGRIFDHPDFYFEGIETLRRLSRELSRKMKWHCADCDGVCEKYRTVRDTPTCWHCGSEVIRPQRSQNWYKARKRLGAHQEHIARQRRYWLWHVANFYAGHYRQIIVYEKMWKYKIKYARTGDEAIRLCDGAAALFVAMLKTKCQDFGTELILRKDVKWQHQEKDLIERAELEGLHKLMRRLQRILNDPRPVHLPFLKRASKQRPTLKRYA